MVGTGCVCLAVTPVCQIPAVGLYLLPSAGGKGQHANAALSPFLCVAKSEGAAKSPATPCFPGLSKCRHWASSKCLLHLLPTKPISSGEESLCGAVVQTGPRSPEVCFWQRWSTHKHMCCRSKWLVQLVRHSWWGWAPVLGWYFCSL